jgi:hypothetical protein
MLFLLHLLEKATAPLVYKHRMNLTAAPALNAGETYFSMSSIMIEQIYIAVQIFSFALANIFCI